MKRLAVKNLLGRPGRTAALFFLVLLLSLTLCGGGLVLSSLRTGLGSLENRLGADVIVMPAKAALKTDLDTLFLQGTIGPYYMSMSTVDKIAKTEGIDRLSTQIFLSSMRASCCSIPIQVIGFDPESDFTVSSWLKESRQESLDDGRLLVGSRVNANPGESIKLYNISCPVAGQLQPTGTGLDTAVYCTLPTIRTLMTAAEDLGGYSSISGDPSETVSAVYIKVKEGVDPKDVADSINVHVRKVKAVQTRSVITTVADSLSGLERILTLLIIAAAVLVWLVLFAAFTLMTGERKKEFATLRLCGLSRGRLAGLVFREAAIVSLLGSAAGVGLSLLLVHAFSGALGNALGLPFLLPSAGTAAALALAAFLGCLLAGPLAAAVSARKLSRADTGLILREG
ncbi:MAG: ABC transporter permease [Clostridia bacterium]|nr:ABC transporter permease [Clostridia bacterium]